MTRKMRDVIFQRTGSEVKIWTTGGSYPHCGRLEAYDENDGSVTLARAGDKEVMMIDATTIIAFN